MSISARRTKRGGNDRDRPLPPLLARVNGQIEVILSFLIFSSGHISMKMLNLNNNICVRHRKKRFTDKILVHVLLAESCTFNVILCSINLE